MNLAPVDWAVIGAYLVAALGIGVVYARRAGKDISEFFLAGRSLPWWLAGTSIVATTFAADTPLAVSGFVRSEGIYGNWFWWSALMGGMLCVFFYARLWRRASVLTDVEFIELRYGGRPAAVLRGFHAVYGGVLSNCIIMGWVMLAMSKIATAVLAWPEVIELAGLTLPGKAILLGVLVVIALAYTVLSGFWGVVVTDLVQFAIAMIGAFALAGIVLAKMGGPAGMVAQVAAAPGVTEKVFHFTPDLGTAARLAVFTFAVYLAVQWWASGQGQGGGYIAQRLMATKNEKHAALAALWFNFAHYVLRTWPWIVVGLASLVYFPLSEMKDPELAYPSMVVKFLPAGLRGLMVVSFLSAFMSTIDTHLNWGASYLVNDLYRRFIRPNASDRHYVAVSRIAVLLLMILGALTAWQMESIKEAWKYLAMLGAGAGLVGLLRWYWWRVNAWSEISALAASLVLTNLLSPLARLAGDKTDLGRWLGEYSVQLVIVVVVATAVWLVVTLLTRPVDAGRLETFFRRVRPGGWWGPIVARCPDVPREKGAAWGWLGWLAGVACIYAGLFGVGYLCLGRTAAGLICLAVCGVCGWFMVRQASRLGISEPAGDEPMPSGPSDKRRRGD